MATIKPKILIDDVYERELTLPVLNEGMKQLIEFSRSLKMNPRHAWAKAFKCVYKGMNVVTFNMHENVLIITVYIADKDDLERIVLAEPDGHEILMEIMNRNLNHCDCCNPSHKCGSSVKLHTTGGNYDFFCSRFNYCCKNPTPEQFKIIERLIEIRKKYIAAT